MPTNPGLSSIVLFTLNQQGSYIVKSPVDLVAQVNSHYGGKGYPTLIPQQVIDSQDYEVYCGDRLVGSMHPNSGEKNKILIKGFDTVLHDKYFPTMLEYACKNLGTTIPFKP